MRTLAFTMCNRTRDDWYGIVEELTWQYHTLNWPHSSNGEAHELTVYHRVCDLAHIALRLS